MSEHGSSESEPSEERLREELGKLAAEWVGRDSGVAEATGDIHHEVVAEGGTRFGHVQRFEAGRLTAWEPTDGPAPWAVRSRSGLLAPPDRAATLTDADLERVAVRLGERAGERVVPFPPLDEWRLGDFDTLPEVADADVLVRFETLDHPIAPMRAEITFTSGRPVERRLVSGFTEADGSVATVGMPWRSYLRWRAGEVTVLEAVEEGGGMVDARWTVLLLIHGIVQQPEWTDAYGALPPLPPELTWWGAALGALA